MTKDVFDKHELREASYWFIFSKYERQEINKFLAFYAKDDDRWQEAFEEVIYL